MRRVASKAIVRFGTRLRTYRRDAGIGRAKTRARGLLRVSFVLALAISNLVLGQACAPRPVEEARRTGQAIVAEAFAQKRSGLVVEFFATVLRVLPDDTKGSRHQRFILAFDDAMTVLVAHNIDLAPRVPLDVGDTLEVRGQYEWNEKGGVVHGTHHDPQNNRPGGWIRHRGRIYE